MTNTTKMTKTAMFAEIINFLEDTPNEARVSVDEAIAFCKGEQDILAKRAAKAKETAAAKKSEADALTDRVFSVISEEAQTLTDIVKALNDEDVTPAKVTYRLGQLINNNKVVKEEITVKNEGYKPRKLMTYKLA